ncbi:MAG: hypothetical protein GEV13_00090 [Rhodospirillales bacterium]|nr:hypothetical protein [Rhodospirillales bacterium]
MTDQEPISIVLELLRAIRGDMTEMKLIMREHATRLSALEATVAGLRLSVDRLEDRIERIERRLGLIEA